MSESDRPLFRSFPMPSRDAWPGLKERNAEHWPSGFAWEGLYTALDALPPTPPPGTGDHTRGVRLAEHVRPPRVGCRIEQTDRAAVREALAHERAGGADLFWLHGRDDPGSHGQGGDDWGPEPGLPPDSTTAVPWADLDLEGCSLVLDLGPGTSRFGRQLPSRLSAGSLDIDLAIDPFAWLAEGTVDGAGVDASLDDLVETASWAHEHAPGWRSVMVSSVPHREAGATATDEVAASIASALAYMRAMTAGGLSVDAAASKLRFTMTVGRDVFGELAKLRALRRLWSRAMYAAGATAGARAAAVYVTTAGVERTGYGRWINQLRATVEGFAALVAGVDGLILEPFDTSDEGEMLGRRLALTTQHILAEEAHLGRVADPAGGSWFLEAITDQLARAAWELVRSFETQGGIGVALRDGSLDERYAKHAARHARDVATRRDRWVGVTAFPDREETRGAAPATTAGDPSASVRRLTVRRPTARFEALRAAADRVAADGMRPTVVLVTVGAQADYQGPVSVASRALAVGGVATEEHHASRQEDASEVGAMLARVGSKVVVLCGADAALRDEGPAHLGRMRDAGARLVLVTAKHESETFWRGAGADLLLDDAFDLYSILCRVHAELRIESDRTIDTEAEAR